MKIIKSFLCLIMMSVSSITYAQFYTELGVHYQQVNIQNKEHTQSYMTPKLTFGYEFTPKLKSDFFVFMHKSTAHYRVENDNPFNGEAEIKPIIGWSFKPNVYTNGPWEIYGDVGITYTSVSTKNSYNSGSSFKNSSSGFDPFFGIAGQYNIDKNIYINIGYIIYDLDRHKNKFEFDTVGLNLGYRF